MKYIIIKDMASQYFFYECKEEKPINKFTNEFLIFYFLTKSIYSIKIYA